MTSLYKTLKEKKTYRFLFMGLLTIQYRWKINQNLKLLFPLSSFFGCFLVIWQGYEWEMDEKEQIKRKEDKFKENILGVMGINERN